MTLRPDDYTPESRWPLGDIKCGLPVPAGGFPLTDDKTIEDCKMRFPFTGPFVGHPSVPPREG